MSTRGMNSLPVDFNLTIQRMVMSAGANRDFATIHHNTTAGKAAGAPDMFLNNVSTLMLWGASDIRLDRPLRPCQKGGLPYNALPRRRRSHTSSRNDHQEVAGAGLNLVEIDVKSETPRMTGQVGTVVVALPSRSNPTTTPDFTNVELGCK